ncbi:DUF218 domain-containing protein [Jannaschia seohaensis]|uniref:DUF218 domain-containing protein n=1 Tax=Jannaschia seohaensis TaxID=475081 RepID=A0A2Y9A1Y5_9RHOB|nr:DUF218 domain-containing protein [Jannaschia seohaensis]SSA38404.1 DUF218 domain-containing protein [Jannaschia seohaensis]
MLGAAVWPGGRPSPTLHLRVEHAVVLWREGRVQAICVAGGRGRHGPPEGEVGVALARAMGVPGAALLAETASRSTVENLAFAAPMLAGREIVLVSNRWHLPRARLAARLLGLRVSADGPVGRLSWPRTLRAALRETVATPWTGWRAWRARLTRPPGGSARRGH